MDSTRKLWIGLGTLLTVSFGILLLMGGEIYRKAPPVPERVTMASGDVVYTRADIERGRQVWQSSGGMQLGSIWGHGGYVAPDWSADWVHREAVAVAGHLGEADRARAPTTPSARTSRRALAGRLRESIRQEHL